MNPTIPSEPRPPPPARSRLQIVMKSNLDDLRSPFFWRGLVAEAVGTLLLVFAGCSAYIAWPAPDAVPTVVQISFTFGLAVASIVWITGHISGGHINPAVTIGMLVARRINLVRAILYITFQCIGAISGSALLYSITPKLFQGFLGATFLSTHINFWQALLVEFIITFIFVLTVFATHDTRRADIRGSSGPFAIGLSVTLCHLFAIKYTKAGMNPARSLGPAVMMRNLDIWSVHWIYWCAPLLGGVVAALLYETILASNVSLTKAREFLLSSTYDSDTYEKNDEYTRRPFGRRGRLSDVQREEDYLKGYDEQPL